MEFDRLTSNGGAFLAPLIYRNDRIPTIAKPLVLRAAQEVSSRLPALVINQIQQRAFTTIDIPSSDPAFEYLNDWAAEQAFMRKSPRLRINSNAPRYRLEDGPDYGTVNADNLRYQPAPGTYRFSYEGRLMWMTRTEGRGFSLDLGTRNRAGDSIELRVLGGSAAPVYTLINDACELAKKRSRQRITIFYGSDGYWDRSSSQRLRPIESVILPKGQRDALTANVKRFIERSDWYSEKAIPYRRGYLLYGLPGSGKSSIVSAIASHFNLQIFVLNLSSNRLSDNTLAHLLGNMTQPSILLLEDVDAIFAQRDLDSYVSFSGLLNALDGVNASQGRLLFMTTNHLDQLDPALIRPGRVDYRIEFTHADKYQATELYRRFFPETTEANAIDFGNKAALDGMSMAEVQEYLLNQAALEEVTV